MRADTVQTGVPELNSPARSRIVREVLTAYAIAFFAVAFCDLVAELASRTVGGWLGGAIAEVAISVGALSLLWLALHRAERSGGARRFGIDFAGLVESSDETAADRERGAWRALVSSLPAAARETAFASVIAALVFPPFVVGFFLWHAPTRPFEVSWPDDPASFVLAQFVLVALPEEAFFRGYVQTRLSDAWPASLRVFGADVSPVALVAQAALFALVHLAADPHVEELATFFPGLLFGWLRARRGGVGAAIAMHAASNLLSDVLVRGWLG